MYSHKIKEKVLIYLLEQEVQALRSVLSEFSGDKYEYIQMLKANTIQSTREDLFYGEFWEKE